MSIGITSFKPKLSRRVILILLAVSGLSLITLIVFSPYIPYSISLKTGEISHQTIVSPRYIEFESKSDKKRTLNLVREKSKLIDRIYTVDLKINKAILEGMLTFFSSLRSYVNNPSAPNFPENIQFLSKGNINHLRTQPPKTMAEIEYSTIQNTENLLNQGLREVDKEKIKQILHKNLKILKLDKHSENLIFAIVSHFIKPNLKFNLVKTQEAINTEITKILPYKTVVREGEPIIYGGDTLTSSHIEILEALNIYGVSANLSKFLGVLLICFFAFLLLERFIYYFNYKIYNKVKYFVLTYLVILIIVSLARFLQGISLYPDQFNFKYLIPIPISSMIISFLVTPNISLLCGTIIALLSAIVYKGDFTLFLFLFLANAVTTFATYRRTQHNQLIHAGYIVGLFNILFILMLGLYKEVVEIMWYGSNMLLALLNGVLSAMISLAILPYFESIFKVTTNQSLLELSNLNHPLLKRLMINAPGTYQHSLMVANLAEAAAEAIGANPILARVGAYYHDIGKIKRPIFFTENQFSGENPHTSLSPRMSKLIIAAHPKDGVELANKYKLPEVLKDIMMEHHGTTMVSFFYTQALQTEEIQDNASSQEAFRYTGPKPHFKESGILMLADSIEAAVKSLEKPTISKIEGIIDKIIKDKLDDRQLDNCPLNFREIDQIRSAFLHIFKTNLHSRLDYQEELNQLMEQAQGNKK
ncbi:MAG: putative nucleotidyltransferase with HDIG domain [Candidatus Marinamargulisbacteria bacterium]|jgi:putative nucleotidyltransferase with HDIG domain